MCAQVARLEQPLHLSHTLGAQHGTTSWQRLPMAALTINAVCGSISLLFANGQGMEQIIAFEGVVRRCPSFVIVYQSVDLDTLLTDRQGLARRFDLLPQSLRQGIAFLRVWCLVELMAAVRFKRVVVMKVGSVHSERASDGCFTFKKQTARRLG